MKILFVYRVEDRLANIGIRKKLHAQIDACKNLGHNVSYINYDNKGIKKNGKHIYSFTKFHNLPFLLQFHYFFTLCRKFIDSSKYDLIYIRYPFLSPSFLKFCRDIKHINSKVKILLELPTYPYDLEFVGIKKLYLFYEKRLQKKLFKYIDRIVHYGNDKTIFDIKTIKSTNGIDVGKIPIKKNKKKGSTIILIAVAKFSFWHGIDRLLHGLKIYENKKFKFELRLIGEGSETPKLKKLAQSLEITDKVTFYGITTGEDLDKLFDEADIAIGSLGLHRLGIKYSAILKAREYAARGIPFILSTKDEYFPDTLPFISYVPENDDPIDLKHISQLYLNKNAPQKIRSYAMNNLRWEILFDKIFNALP